jgi:hypothetical protein
MQILQVVRTHEGVPQAGLSPSMGGAVSWSSKKQATTAASTIEVKYQACEAAAREGLSLLKALGELSLLSGVFPLVGPV